MPLIAACEEKGISNITEKNVNRNTASHQG